MPGIRLMHRTRLLYLELLESFLIFIIKRPHEGCCYNHMAIKSMPSWGLVLGC